MIPKSVRSCRFWLALESRPQILLRFMLHMLSLTATSTDSTVKNKFWWKTLLIAVGSKLISFFPFTVLFEISRILNTGLDMETLSICVRLCEQGINPEALSSVIKELRKATEALKVFLLIKKHVPLKESNLCSVCYTSMYKFYFEIKSSLLIWSFQLPFAPSSASCCDYFAFFFNLHQLT